MGKVTLPLLSPYTRFKTESRLRDLTKRNHATYNIMSVVFSSLIATGAAEPLPPSVFEQFWMTLRESGPPLLRKKKE